jgi:hypothetical protein
MANDTHDLKASTVERAAKVYAKAASSGRPLASVEKLLLDSVAALIGQTVTAGEPATPRAVTAPLPLSTPPTDAPSVAPVNSGPTKDFPTNVPPRD